MRIPLSPSIISSETEITVIFSEHNTYWARSCVRHVTRVILLGVKGATLMMQRAGFKPNIYQWAVLVLLSTLLWPWSSSLRFTGCLLPEVWHYCHLLDCSLPRRFRHVCQTRCKMGRLKTFACVEKTKKAHLSRRDSSLGAATSISVTFLLFWDTRLGFSISISPSTPLLFLDCVQRETAL